METQHAYWVDLTGVQSARVRHSVRALKPGSLPVNDPRHEIVYAIPSLARYLLRW